MQIKDFQISQTITDQLFLIKTAEEKRLKSKVIT